MFVSTVKQGDRVFVYMSSAKKKKRLTLARPFHGPYQVVETADNGVMVTPIKLSSSGHANLCSNYLSRMKIPDTFVA